MSKPSKSIKSIKPKDQKPKDQKSALSVSKTSKDLTETVQKQKTQGTLKTGQIVWNQRNEYHLSLLQIINNGGDMHVSVNNQFGGRKVQTDYQIKTGQASSGSILYGNTYVSTNNHGTYDPRMEKTRKLLTNDSAFGVVAGLSLGVKELSKQCLAEYKVGEASTLNLTEGAVPPPKKKANTREERVIRVAEWTYWNISHRMPKLSRKQFTKYIKSNAFTHPVESYIDQKTSKAKKREEIPVEKLDHFLEGIMYHLQVDLAEGFGTKDFKGVNGYNESILSELIQYAYDDQGQFIPPELVKGKRPILPKPFREAIDRICGSKCEEEEKKEEDN